MTVEKLAKEAKVSPPMIYFLFQSKLGILRILLDEALPQNQFLSLVEEFNKEKSADKKLMLSARIARQMYDAEKNQMDLFRGASVLTAELKELEKERENRRYERQEEGIIAIKPFLKKGLSIPNARDILWSFTGRDMYRLFVIERGWSSDDYERWLGQFLIKTLLK